MSEKNNLFKTMQRLWDQTSVPARISGSAFAVLSVVAMIGISYWLLQPHYVPLANDLPPQKAAEVVSLLEAEGIANKRNFSGTGILVDQSEWNKANSLIATVVDPSKIEQDPFGQSILDDPGNRDYRLTRDREIQLEKTIGRMKNVDFARVHLAIPEASPFVRDQREKKASVTIGFQAGTSLTRKTATSIVSIVASSVEGLSPENVNVSDTNNNSFSADDSISGAASGQLEFRSDYERYLIQKAESQLVSLLGHGRARVELTADLDFTKNTERLVKYNNDKAVTEESIENTKDTTAGGGALGATGTSGNLGAGGGRRNQEKVLSSKEKLDKKFEVGKTETTKTVDPGQLKRLTISVMVQLQNPPTDSDDPDASAEPVVSKVTKEDIENTVKSAVGFDIERNDEIHVLVVDQLAGHEDFADLFVPPSAIETWTPLVKSGSLGIAALVALLLGFLTLKRIQTVVPVAPVNETAVSPERARQLSELSLLARKNPEVLGNILAAWAGDGEVETSKQTTKAA